jgi:cobalt-zinc-cadmium efflux system protein
MARHAWSEVVVSDHGHVHAGHVHGAVAARRAGGRYRRRLALAFAVVGAFFFVELVAGLVVNSLALLSDAGHMFTDVIGLGMGLAAITIANRPAGGQRTFGLYRTEILAALANAVLLFVVAGLVLYEAARRLDHPVDVASGPLLVVASVGLVVNVIAFLLLREGARASINVEGAYLEVLADLLGSLGAIAAGIVIRVTGWNWVDAAAGAVIGVFILPRTWRLARQALRVLVESAPPHLDVEALRGDLHRIAGVVDVHDVHAWTLTSDMDVASAHLMVASGTDTHRVLDQARAMLAERYHVSHATLQIEPDDHLGCEQVDW